MQSRSPAALLLAGSIATCVAACVAAPEPAEQPGEASAAQASATEVSTAQHDEIDEIAQQAYVKAGKPAVNDYFGNAVALSADGKTLAVGARFEDGTGAVHVFRRHAHSWVAQATLKGASTAARDDFGYQVALSADGSILAVSAISEDGGATHLHQGGAAPVEDAGAVYVFARRGKKWCEEAYVKASDPRPGAYFGYSLGLSADGATLAVGAIESGTLDTPPGTGAAYVFTRSDASWSQEARLVASNAGVFDLFGYGLALSDDGGTLAVGAVGEASAATGVGGNDADDSVFQAGAVYVFTRAAVAWSQEAYVKAGTTGEGAAFGISVALSADGGTLAAGAQGQASGAGAAYVYTRAGGAWSLAAPLAPEHPDASDLFGVRLAISDDGATIAASAIGESSAAAGVNGNPADDSAPFSGAVYLFERAAVAFRQQAYLKASNPDEGDVFGFAVALSGDAGALAVGAIGESSAAAGAGGGGDQADDSAPSAGAVYVFARRHP